MSFSPASADMSSSHRIIHQIKADLRNYPSRCIALEADRECLVCWKAPDAEAHTLVRPDVVISARLIYAEWESLDPLTGAPGDTLSLFCRAESHNYSGLAKLESKQLMEDLGRQSTLKVFILDERLNVVGKKEIEWDERKRAEARRLLDHFLNHLEGDPLRHHAFVRPNPALQAGDLLSQLPGVGADL